MKQPEISKQVKNKVKQTVRKASPWLVLCGRFGYVAKGVIYIIVGVLAAYSAISASAANDGTRSAMRHIEELPFGQILLVILAVGLIAHALWRILQAFMDTENRGAAAKGIFARGIYAIIALIYLGLAFSAVKIVFDVRSGEIWSQSWTAWLLAQTFGQWLVGAAGLVMFAAALFQFYQASAAKFRENLLFDEMSEAQEKWAERVGRSALRRAA